MNLHEATVSVELALKCGHLATVPADELVDMDFGVHCDECEASSGVVTGLSVTGRGEWSYEDLYFELYGDEGGETVEV